MDLHLVPTPWTSKPSMESCSPRTGVTLSHRSIKGTSHLAPLTHGGVTPFHRAKCWVHPGAWERGQGRLDQKMSRVNGTVRTPCRRRGPP